MSKGSPLGGAAAHKRLSIRGSCLPEGQTEGGTPQFQLPTSPPSGPSGHLPLQGEAWKTGVRAEFLEADVKNREGSYNRSFAVNRPKQKTCLGSIPLRSTLVEAIISQGTPQDSRLFALYPENLSLQTHQHIQNPHPRFPLRKWDKRRNNRCIFCLGEFYS